MILTRRVQSVEPRGGPIELRPERRQGCDVDLFVDLNHTEKTVLRESIARRGSFSSGSWHSHVATYIRSDIILFASPPSFSTPPSSSPKKRSEPRKVLLEELDRCGVSAETGNGVDSRSGTAHRVVAGRAASNGHEPYRRSSQSDAAQRATADRDQDADGAASKGNESDGEAAHRNEASSKSSESDPARRDVPKRKDAARMPAHLSSFQVRTDGHRPERQSGKRA